MFSLCKYFQDSRLSCKEGSGSNIALVTAWRREDGRTVKDGWCGPDKMKEYDVTDIIPS